MRRFRRGKWRASIALVSLLALLVFMVLIPLSASAYTGASGPPQATPTVNVTATITALQEEQLTLQNKQLQQNGDRGFSAWLWSNAAAIVASFLSTLVVVGGALIGFWQWRMNRNDTRTKESIDRKEAQDKDLKAQAEERFKTAVTALGGEKESVQIGGAILLRSFLNKEDESLYGRYYIQIFDLAVAYLSLPRPPHLSESSDTPLTLTSLRQTLIVVFREVFPLARNKLGPIRRAVEGQSLDASHIRLDNAFLNVADLEHAWMIEASLRKANLIGTKLRKAVLLRADLREADLRNANLTGASLIEANLTEAQLNRADFSEANLSKTHPEEAKSLKNTDLRGVTGLTRKQLLACKAKGAIVDEDILASSPPLAVPSSTSSQNTSAQTPSAQAGTPPPGTNGSSASATQQSDAVQTSAAVPSQTSIPAPSTGESGNTSESTHI